MTARLLLIRPQEQAARMADDLAAAGIASLISPVLTLQPLPYKEPDWNDYAALILTSAAAVPALQERTIPSLPLYAVGPQTAEALSRALPGHSVINGAGNARDLIARILENPAPGAKPYLYLSGETVSTPLDTELNTAGIPCERLSVYRAIPAPGLSAAAIDALKAQKISAIPFHSARTAQTFLECIRKAGLENTLKTIKALCISKAVLNSLNASAWKKTYSCDTPDRAAMMQLIKTVCLSNE